MKYAQGYVANIVFILDLSIKKISNQTNKIPYSQISLNTNELFRIIRTFILITNIVYKVVDFLVFSNFNFTYMNISSLIILGATFPGIKAVQITISIFFNVSDKSSSCFCLKSSEASFA